MASLPLFSPSFMPKDGASFASVRPVALEPRRPGPQDARSKSGLQPGLQPTLWDLPAMRSLFDPMPARAPAPASAPSPAPSPAPSLPIPIPETPIVSTVERTEAALREAGLAGCFWRGNALSTSSLPAIPSGFRALDEQLPGGGWPSRCLTELLLSHVGVGEIRFLATTLSSLTKAGREIVLLGPPHIPDPTGWEQLGIDMRRVLIVRTPRPADRLWALEQSLKSSAFGALIAWLPEEKTLARNDALRRLQLAAASANGLTFLMRPSGAQYHASPAPLRLTLAAGRPEGARRTLSVRLLKRRGPVLAQPLTLMLPEIHRGMKAFDVATRETAAAPTSRSILARSRSTSRSIDDIGIDDVASDDVRASDIGVMTSAVSAVSAVSTTSASTTSAS